jgi:hypothetical protein
MRKDDHSSSGPPPRPVPWHGHWYHATVDNSPPIVGFRSRKWRTRGSEPRRPSYRSTLPQTSPRSAPEPKIPELAKSLLSVLRSALARGFTPAR